MWEKDDKYKIEHKKDIFVAAWQLHRSIFVEDNKVIVYFFDKLNWLIDGNLDLNYFLLS